MDAMQKQLPVAEMCKVPGLHDRNSNAHQADPPTSSPSAEGGGTQAQGRRDGGTGPRSSDKHVCSHTPPPTHSIAPPT